MSARTSVTVYGLDGQSAGTAQLPPVFSTPIRRDIVQFVHTNVRKNSRQAYGVKNRFGPMGIVAGHQHSAHSWGTGRAVSRIPRVSGGGTHRAGQAAFGNMCRGGRMFAPLKTYRKWHRKVNTTMKRQAAASCIAATGITPMVMGRGHRVGKVAEFPIVVSNDIESLKKTKDAVAALTALNLGDELEKCQRKQSRPGKGSMRGRRYKRRRGPLIVYKNDDGLVKAFRNIPGVDLCSVDCLNVLQLAPGGHSGRLVVYTQAALDSLKTWLDGKKAPKVIMKNADLNALINSDEIQSVIREQRSISKVPRKRNLLSNKKSRFETFRGFSLEEVNTRKRKRADGSASNKKMRCQ